MNIPNIKKLLTSLLFLSCFLLLASCFFSVFAADFIIPNSSGEPIIIDISDLNLTTGLDVSVGEFTDQPRTYRDLSTKSIAIFPPAGSDSERTIQIRAGSTTVTKTVSFRSSPDGNLKDSSLPDLHEARAGNTATKISDGRVVLIGGSKGLADTPVNSLEVFNPEVGRSDLLKTPDDSKKAKLQISRSQHTATYLGISSSPLGMISGPVEQILVTGGFSNNGLLESSIEIVEINVGSNQGVSTLLSSKKSKLKKARIYHTASLLPDGRVLIIGGQGRINKTNLGALNSLEIFDPVTKSVQVSSNSLSTSRLLHTSTILQNGNILIAGGFTNEKSNSFGLGPATDTAELINTKDFTIKKVGLLKKSVGGHTATLLTNGLVLIVGGNNDLFAGLDGNIARGLSVGTIQYYSSSNETFKFVTNKSTEGNLDLQTARFLHQTVLLPNGNLAVIGGLNIKPGFSTEQFINTPVSKIEVLSPDLAASGDTLKVDQKAILETATGRILPTAVLVTPKNKTQGFLSPSDISKFVNCAVYVTGGFTNGFGKLPTKATDLLQIESNVGIEGRSIEVTPNAIIQGSYLDTLLVQIGEFSAVPSLKVEPQAVNLSSSNNFLSTAMVFSTNDQSLLLKPVVSTDLIIVSPSLFQTGDNVTITRKDPSVQGQFDVSFVPASDINSFIPAKLTVNVSNSSMPFLVTVPPYGISLSVQEGFNIQPVQIKIFSEDGMTELTSVLPNTFITATIQDPEIANIIGTGISSVTGTIQTQFQIKAVKPGKTTLTFSINSTDILPISIPVQVSATPTFSSSTSSIDNTVLDGLSTNGVSFSGTKNVNSTSFSLQDVIISINNSIFPIYVPINLQSSIDGSISPGLFTIRPIFGVDLLTALPRTFVNKGETNFRTPLIAEPTAIGGFVSSDIEKDPVAALASDDGLRTVTFVRDNQNLTGSLSMLSNDFGVKELKFFKFGTDKKQTKIVLLKGSMISLIDAESGEQESSATLSGEGFELVLTEINNQTAAVVSVGTSGVDLVFPVTDAEPRVENSRVATNVKHITVVNKIGDKAGPYVVAYDDAKTISIRNLTSLNDPVQSIDTNGERFTKIDYAGKFLVNNKTTDVLICAGERSVTLFDLNNLTTIPVNEALKIKNKIEDLLVIDGTAYLALGDGGILALSVGGLIDNSKQAIITTFTKNKLTVVKASGKETFITKPLSANKLANAKPFLLSSGPNNNLTVIRVSP